MKKAYWVDWDVTTFVPAETLDRNKVEEILNEMGVCEETVDGICDLVIDNDEAYKRMNVIYDGNINLIGELQAKIKELEAHDAKMTNSSNFAMNKAAELQDSLKELEWYENWFKALNGHATIQASKEYIEGLQAKLKIAVDVLELITGEYHGKLITSDMWDFYKEAQQALDKINKEA